MMMMMMMMMMMIEERRGGGGARLSRGHGVKRRGGRQEDGKGKKGEEGRIDLFTMIM